MDLAGVKKIYFIGIKGVAMSGLAVICQKRGLAVCGSDVEEKFITDKILAKNNIEVFENFDIRNLACNPDLVVIGASWDETNIEVAEVKTRNLPVISDSELRGILSKEKRTIAITGVHGKTTTTALISFIFRAAGLDPSFLIGTGAVRDLGGNSDWTTGRHFIIEGDEYAKSRDDKSPKFLDLLPAVTVITSIEWEHVDIFPNVELLEKNFSLLINKTSDLVVACGDWESVKKITVGNKKNTTYGLDDYNEWQATEVKAEFDFTAFKVINSNGFSEEFKIKLFGLHNVLNALAAIIVSLNEGINVDALKNILPKFAGTERRFDVSESNGVIFIDDYAHHPTAVKTTLEAVRHRYPDQEIWCIFQPHMASRTKAFLNEFAQSFAAADKVIFADIFASAREELQDVTSKLLAAKTAKNHRDSVYVGDLNQVVNYLKDKVKPGVVVVTMGAGDVYRVRDKLLN
ncbi:MAG: UDP-N-acetylmuramate--L-alanine ligase [Patescibacteria group bacterium]|nr:UDP-N-acetylmuramate--L-alanine ligase [Patescibacteria group bacterium]